MSAVHEVSESASLVSPEDKSQNNLLDSVSLVLVPICPICIGTPCEWDKLGVPTMENVLCSLRGEDSAPHNRNI